MLRLSIDVRGRPRQERRFDEPEIVIGSDEGVTLRLERRYGVSRRHARLFADGGQLLVEDLGARNGVLLGGKLVVDAAVVTIGDELEIGTVKLRVLEHVADATVATTPRAAGAAAPERPAIVDEFEACRTRIGPLARRWRELGRPEHRLLRGPWLARGVAWVASERRLRPRPGELEREYIDMSRQYRRTTAARWIGAMVLPLLGLASGLVAARLDHADLAFPARASLTNVRPTCADEDAPGTQVAGEQAILAGVQALRSATEACARQNGAEARLRLALEGRRSFVIGRSRSPIVFADVGADERDIVTMDERGVVSLWDRTDTHSTIALDSEAARVVALGPEGRWLAVGLDAGVDLWDLGPRAAPRRLAQLRRPSSAAVTALSFSEDGRYLVSGDRRGNVQIWDMRGIAVGQLLAELSTQGDPLERVTLRDASTRLFALGEARVHIWELGEGKPRGKRIELTSDGDATDMAVTGRGDEVLVGDSLGQVTRWNLAAPRRPAKELIARHDAPVVALAHVPHAHLIASVAADRTVLLSELAVPRRASERSPPIGLLGLAAAPVALTAESTGRRIAVAARDHRIYVWDVARRHTSAQPFETFAEHSDTIVGIVPGRDANALLSASRDGSLRSWSLQDPGIGGSLAVLSDHRGPLVGLDLSADGKRLLSAGRDRSVRAWQLGVQGARNMLTIHHESAIQSAALSVDGRWAAVGLERRILLYDLQADEPGRQPIERVGHGGSILHTMFTGDRRYLVSADFEGRVLLWPMFADGPADRPAGGPVLGRAIDVLAAPRDASYLAVATTDHRVWVHGMDDLDGASGRLATHHDGSVLTLAFTGDGRYLVSAGEDAWARVRKLDRSLAMTEVPAIHHDHRVRAAAFSPSGRWLATGSDDQKVRVIDVRDISADPLVLTVHDQPITAVAFDHGEDLLLTAAADGAIALWRTDQWERRQIGAPMLLRGHRAAIQQLRIDQIGDVAVTSDELGSIRVWPLSHRTLAALGCRAVRRELTAAEGPPLCP